MKKAVVLTASLVLACSARADYNMYRLGQPQTTSLGLFTGAIVSGDTEEQSEVWGAQAIFNATRYFAVTLDGTFFKDSLPRQAYSDRGVQFVTAGDLNVIRLGLSGRLTLPVSDFFAVYGAAGVGYYLYSAEGEKVVVNEASLPPGIPLSETDLTLDTKAQLGGQAALGVQFVLNENVEVFAEYNVAVVDLDLTYDATVDTETEVMVMGEEGTPATTRIIGNTYKGESSVTDGYSHGTVRVGLNFYF
jgi:opacity protein-like surface antigen